MRVGYLITARLKSTRLPMKLMRNIAGKPVIAHMLDRLKLSKAADIIVICTSSNPQDNPLIDIAAENGVEHFCGDPDDVLARMYGAAEKFDLDYILSITGDCPFSDPFYGDKIVACHAETNADFIRALDLPLGAFCYGLKTEAVKKVLEIKDSQETEVWGKYFTDTDLFKVVDLPIDNALHRRPDLRMTLDYPEDLKFFKAVFSHLYQAGKVFSLDEIIQLLNEYPDIVAINRSRVEAYEKRINTQSDIHLKSRYEIRKAAIIGYDSKQPLDIQIFSEENVAEVFFLDSAPPPANPAFPNLRITSLESWDDLLDTAPDVVLVYHFKNYPAEELEKLFQIVRGIYIDASMFKKALPSLANLKKVVTYINPGAPDGHGVDPQACDRNPGSAVNVAGPADDLITKARGDIINFFRCVREGRVRHRYDVGQMAEKTNDIKP